MGRDFFNKNFAGCAAKNMGGIIEIL